MSQKPMRIKNEWLQKTYHSLALSLILLGSLVFSSIAVESAEPAEAKSELPSLLQHILAVEFPEVQVTQRKLGKKGDILYFNNENQPTHSLYGPIERDLDDDGVNEVVIGCRFMDKLNNQDFLAVYTVSKDSSLKRQFRKRFRQSDKGEFLDIQVKDLTSNGLLDISVTYMFADAGMSAWDAEDVWYLIRGRFPFDSLLELRIGVRRGGDSGVDNHFMDTKLDVKDVDSDDINEVIATQYEGKDRRTLKRTTSYPLIYRASFRLTTYAFEHLEKKGLSEELLQALQPLEDQEFATKGDFLHAVEQQIGEEHVRKYETLLIQYGISQYRLENDHE